MRHPPTDELEALLHAGSGHRPRVLDLPTLIEIKRSTGRARDALVVPLLLAIQARTAGR